MSNQHRHPSWTFAVLLSLCVGVTIAGGCQRGDDPQAAAPKVGVANHADTDPSYQPTMDLAEQQLQQLEALVANVLNTHQLSDADSTTIDNVMQQYAGTMYQGFNIASNDAQQAADTQGAQGSTDTIQAFETTAQDHANRTNTLAQNMDAIDDGLANGTINGHAALDRKVPAAAPVKFAARPARKDAKTTVSSVCRGAAKAVSDFLVPPAHASVAIPCIAPCAAQNWPACIGCIAGAVGSAISAWNTFRDCWNSCSCHWYSFWCCAKKGWCLAVFIAKLA
jgi:hypothetical protein